MSAQENAEAIILVIKRLAKWLIIFVASLVLLSISIYAYLALEQYYTYDKHKELVNVHASFDEEKCTLDFPLLIRIENNSTKKVMNVDVSVTVTKVGRSTKLNNYHNFESDVILEPSKSAAFCYAVYDDSFSNPQILNGDGMDVKVSYYSVVFE